MKNILILTILQKIMKDGNRLKKNTLNDLKRLNPSIEDILKVLRTIHIDV